MIATIKQVLFGRVSIVVLQNAYCPTSLPVLRKLCVVLQNVPFFRPTQTNLARGFAAHPPLHPPAVWRIRLRTIMHHQNVSAVLSRTGFGEIAVPVSTKPVCEQMTGYPIGSVPLFSKARY